MSASGYGLDPAERDTKFENFAENLVSEQCLLFDVVEEDHRNFEIHIDNELSTPLYEMNKNFCWPRRRHLQQGVAALAGLPE
jgi:hypothetical protein